MTKGLPLAGVFTVVVILTASTSVLAQEASPPPLEGQAVVSAQGTPFIEGWNYFTVATAACNAGQILNELQADGGSSLNADALWLKQTDSWQQQTVDSAAIVSTDQTIAFLSNTNFFFDLDPKNCEEVDIERQRQIQEVRDAAQVAQGQSILGRIFSYPVDLWNKLFNRLDDEQLVGFTPERSDLQTQTRSDLSNLTVSGDSVLGDTVVSGDLQIGGLTLSGVSTSVDALGTLKIQPLALGPIEFVGGKITIDTDGNIKTDGSVESAKVKTNELCLGDTCITEDQLIILLDK